MGSTSLQGVSRASTASRERGQVSARRLAGIVCAVFTAVVFLPAAFAATVLPYRIWDSLAYGSWSRLIERAGGFVTDGTADVFVQRPLFYVTQGMLWHSFGFHQALGRWLSLAFALILVGALWALAARLRRPGDGDAVAALAVVLLLACPIFVSYVAAGMTDVPVAAAVTSTGALAFALVSGAPRARLLTLATGVAALAAVLAKPSGLLGLAGVALAVAVAARAEPARRHAALAVVAAIGAGAAGGVLYAAAMAARFHESLLAFLTAGNDSYWRARGSAALGDRMLAADWLGDGLRLPLLFGLLLAVARLLGARGRFGTGLAAAAAIAWAGAGPVVAHGGAPYPFGDSGPLEAAGTAAVVLLIAAAVWRPDADPLPRWAWGAMLAWIVPVALPALAVRSDEPRFLSPAWAPACVLAAGALAVGVAALARAWRRPTVAGLAPVAIGLLVLANLPAVDGLGRTGWDDLLALGREGWSDRAQVENLAYGPFSYELDSVRRYAGRDGIVVSSDGRLSFFLPGRVRVSYARSCADLRGARVFTLLVTGESVEFMKRVNSTADPLRWSLCTSPSVSLVQEQPGEYATFVVGRRAVAVTDPGACRIRWHRGELGDAVFGEGLGYRAAAALAGRARSVGYPAKIERTGCEEFRVVVTGIQPGVAGRRSFREEAAQAGLVTRYYPSRRYPAVAIGVVPPQPTSR